MNFWWTIWANDPFNKARIRLTVWYVLILGLLIGFFTYLTFQAKESAYVRVYTVVKNSQGGEQKLVELQDTYGEFNRRFRERVLWFDAVLVAGGGGMAWWLAGKTLKPIKTMVAEQQAFAQDLSHGLKTPITAMKLLLEAESRTKPKPSPRDKKLYQALNYELQHMQAVVGGVLTLTQTGTTLAPGQKVDWGIMAQRLTESLLPLAEVKGIQLNWVGVKQKFWVWGSQEQIYQAMTTLIDNAIKYTPKGGRVSLNQRKLGLKALLTVTDTGPGINPEDKKKIFEKYYRGREENKSQGTGLGLAIAKRLIEANGGSISVKDNPKGGAIFRVKLPLGKDA